MLPAARRTRLDSGRRRAVQQTRLGALLGAGRGDRARLQHLLLHQSRAGSVPLPTPSTTRLDAHHQHKHTHKHTTCTVLYSMLCFDRHVRAESDVQDGAGDAIPKPTRLRAHELPHAGAPRPRPPPPILLLPFPSPLFSLLLDSRSGELSSCWRHTATVVS